MKLRSEVEARVRTLLLQEMDRRVEQAHRRLPRGCVHNHRQQLDPRKKVEDEISSSYNRVDRRHLPVVPEIGLCMLGAEDPSEWKGTICEDPVDAQRCEDFTPNVTKATLIDQFTTEIRDPVWLEENLPELFALLWVLGKPTPDFKLPWWKRVLFWLTDIRVDPVDTRGIGNYLLPGDDNVSGS